MSKCSYSVAVSRKAFNNTSDIVARCRLSTEGNITVASVYKAFFNGEMYGIKELCDRRVGNEEKNKFTTVSFKTDYYTHRVMSLVYQDLLEKGNIAPPEGVNDINKYYPFLTSLGMDVLLVIENKEKVVLAKRSKKLINMKEDQWHLSMNEAVSITDLYLGTVK